jgi:hypothetical protein
MLAPPPGRIRSGMVYGVGVSPANWQIGGWPGTTLPLASRIGSALLGRYRSVTSASLPDGFWTAMPVNPPKLFATTMGRARRVLRLVPVGSPSYSSCSPADSSVTTTATLPVAEIRAAKTCGRSP